MVADSLAAIKYGKVRVIATTGLATDYRNEAQSLFRNSAATTIRSMDCRRLVVMTKLRKHSTYRNATHTQSVLTITSTWLREAHRKHPDGRRGKPFAPSTNPMHGRDCHGWLASCLSVAKLPYVCLGGISYRLSRAAEAYLSDTEIVDAAVKAMDT